MPSRDEHLAKADHNAEVLRVLLGDRSSPEWPTVLLFYRAVHLVEAWFALRGSHNRSHQMRSRAVHRDLPEIAADYDDILKASRLARYEPAGLVSWGDYERLAEGLTRIEERVRADLR
jgi:hypothetical protein